VGKIPSFLGETGLTLVNAGLVSVAILRNIFTSSYNVPLISKVWTAL